MLPMPTRRALERAPLLIVVDARGDGPGPREPQWEARGFRVRRHRAVDLPDALAQLELSAAERAGAPLVVWLTVQPGDERDVEALLRSSRIDCDHVAVVFAAPGLAYGLRSPGAAAGSEAPFLGGERN